jgi:hypothetical protein
MIVSVSSGPKYRPSRLAGSRLFRMKTSPPVAVPGRDLRRAVGGEESGEMPSGGMAKLGEGKRYPFHDWMK